MQRLRRMEQDGKLQFLGQVAGQLGLAGTRRAAEHHIEGLDDAVLGILCAAKILVLDLCHFGLDVVHAYQVVDGAVYLRRLDELERLELAPELEVQEGQHAERQRGRQHAADAGLPAVLLGLRAGAGKALIQALEQFEAGGAQLSARNEDKPAAPRRGDGLVSEDLGLHVAGVIRVLLALRFDQDDAFRYVPHQWLVDHRYALDRVVFQEAQRRAGAEYHGQLVIERPERLARLPGNGHGLDLLGHRGLLLDKRERIDGSGRDQHGNGQHRQSDGQRLDHEPVLQPIGGLPDGEPQAR
jgi:hypothetical protein